MNTDSDWLNSVRRLVEVVTTSLTTPGAMGATGHGSDCQRCPVCQAAAVVRGERPEVSAALADVLTATSAALRSFAEAVPESETEQQPEPEPEHEPVGDAAPPASAAARHSPPVSDPLPEAQRIEIV